MQWRNWIQTCKTGDQMYSECSLVYLFKCQIVGLHWVGGTTLDPFIDLSGLELCLAIPDFTSLVSIHGSGYPGDPSSEDYWIIYLTSFFLILLTDIKSLKTWWVNVLTDPYYPKSDQWTVNGALWKKACICPMSNKCGYCPSFTVSVVMTFYKHYNLPLGHIYLFKTAVFMTSMISIQAFISCNQCDQSWRFFALWAAF